MNKETGTAVKDRLLTNAVKIAMNRATIENAIFQHSVLCQTFLPYRDPGKDVTLWERRNGKASLAIQVMQQKNTEGEYEYPGLPFGTKGRLILAHLNSQAVKRQSPVIDVEQTVTGFLKTMGLSKTGTILSAVKEQLRRINSSVISISYEGLQADLKIVKAFDVSFQKNDNQRLLWNSNITLSQDYFENLMSHAVPLDERALIALSHNAMAMDVYAWLVQRLHRIDPINPQAITWAALKAQFGPEQSSIRKFRQVFRHSLKTALSQYMKAKISEEGTKGLILYNSPTPIMK